MEVVKLNGALGAHIIGIDRAGGLLDSDFTLFADALAEHSVLAVDAAAMHHAVFDYQDRRLMNRISVIGPA